MWVRRQDQLVSRISAAVERRMPTKVTTEIKVIARLWMAGIGPSGIRRLRGRTRFRNTWRNVAATTYVDIAAKRNDHVDPHDWALFHLKLTTVGCSDNQYFMFCIMAIGDDTVRNCKNYLYFFLSFFFCSSAKVKVEVILFLRSRFV